MTPEGTSRPPFGFSVRARILTSMLVLTAVGMGVAGITAYLVQRDRTLADVDTNLAAAVDEAGFIATDAGGATVGAVLEDIVQRYRPGTDQSTLGIIDGAVALVPGGNVSFSIAADPQFVDRVVAETSDGEVIRGTASADDRVLRYIAVPVSVTGDPSSGIFVTAFDLEAELRPIDDAFRTFAIVALAALVVVGAIGWLIAGRLLRPLRTLRDAAMRITGTDTTERIPVVGRDDVSDLTTTVNGMLERLDGALTSQRQLLDDVGHELKTPLTIVRGHLELMDVADASDVAATRDIAIDELDRMSGLVRDISTLAVLDRSITFDPAPTEIAALTESVRTKASAISGHIWCVGESASVIAEIDADRMTQALLQLSANAATHGAAGGVITIGTTASRSSDGSRRLALWVQNDGDGIDEETQAIIFERFRRGSAGRGAAGSGLGLAIVSAIASAHGGSVGVASSVGRGARFTIDIPLVVPDPVAQRPDVAEEERI